MLGIIGLFMILGFFIRIGEEDEYGDLTIVGWILNICVLILGCLLILISFEL